MSVACPLDVVVSGICRPTRFRAVASRVDESRPVSPTAVQRRHRKRRVRCCSSRDRRQEREQERVRAVVGGG